MKLLIDIGNSRIKWAYLHGNALENPQVITYKDLDQNELIARLLLGREAPEQVYIANVGGSDIGSCLAAAISNKWDFTPVFAVVEPEFAGVTHAYRDISQLGVDRWLAMIAAWTRYQSPVCVVSCGTAVTVDGVSAAGAHLGGLIIPGVNMMQIMLIRETRGIRAEPGANFSRAFGRSTAECINSGAVRAVVSLVDDVVAEMAGQFGERLSCVISGGYAEQINALLAVKFVYDPHLVLRGLAMFAEKTA